MNWILAASLCLPLTLQDGAAQQRRLVSEAQSLWHEAGEYDAALRAFDAAVELDPENVSVRMERAIYLMWLAEATLEEQQARFREGAVADLRFVSSRDPDSRLGGLARDSITRLLGTELFPPVEVACSEEADAVAGDAHDLFGSDQFEEALAAYRRAAELCPESALLKWCAANTLYALERYEEAARGFRDALEVDPWNRKAHQFLADAEWELGHRDAALREAALAVVSDPACESAWMTLRAMAEGTEREFLRVYREKARVVIEPDEGTQLIVPEGIDEPTRMGWIAYLTCSAAELGERDLVPDPDRLAFERRTVESTLQILDELAESDPALERDAFWAQLTRARDAGFLDEAILLHLVDADLAPVHVARRDEERERFATYLLDHVVPPR